MVMYMDRNTIEREAARLHCLQEVAPLNDVDAVRLLQAREGYTPCFARADPLVPLGGFPRKCALYKCTWYRMCESFRPGSGRNDLGWTLRQAVERKARQLGCLDDVTELNDVEAVRFVQTRERYSPCFGRETPLVALPSEPLRCSLVDCYWLGTCDTFRSTTVRAIERDLEGKSKTEIASFVDQLHTWNSHKDQFFQSRAVGLKLRSLARVGSLMRKMLVATPKTVIGERSDTSLKAYLLRSELQRVASYPSTDTYITSDVLFTSDLRSLNQWMNDATSFIYSGDVAYYPLIEQRQSPARSYSKSQAYASGEGVDFFKLWRTPDYVSQLQSFDAKHAGLPDGEAMLTEEGIAPLLNLDLPVLEEVSFDALFRVMNDYPEELCSFRNFLYSSVADIQTAAIGSNEFYADCRKVERRIQDEIRKLRSGYKKARITAAFSLTGCAVASWTLALYCILGHGGDILKVLGPGGIAYTASAAYSQYLVNCLDLRDNPCYFLWVLGKTKPNQS